MKTNVEEAAIAVATAITSQIEAALAEEGNQHRRPFELMAASQGLDAEAAALGDPATVTGRVELLRAQLAQLTDPAALAERRLVMSRAAERLREAVNAGHAG